MKKQFKLVPKMISPNCADIWCVSNNHDDGILIARVLFPTDGQLNDNLDCLQELCTSLKRRIRKSV